MSSWWYIAKNKKKGPLTDEKVKGLLLSNKLNDETKMWKEGMSEWTPLAQIQELNEFKQTLPPPVPKPPKPTIEDYPEAGAWKRFFARMFDFWLEVIPVSFLGGFILASMFPGFSHWLEQNTSLYSLLCVPVALVLDSIIHRVFGNTPGKALLGVKVRDQNLKPLSFLNTLRRNLAMWFSGLGLSLPIVSLVTMFMQFRRRNKGQPASYDELYEQTLIVKGKPIGPIASIAFATLLFGIVVFYAYLSTLTREDLDEHTFMQREWQNPLSQKTTSIPTRWQPRLATADDGSEYVEIFDSLTDSYMAIFKEKTNDVSMSSYLKILNNVAFPELELFKRENDPDYEPLILVHERGNQKHHTWSNSVYKTIDKQAFKWEVNVFRWDGYFWRIFIVTPAYSDQAHTASEYLYKKITYTIPGHFTRTYSKLTSFESIE